MGASLKMFSPCYQHGCSINILFSSFEGIEEAQRILWHAFKLAAPTPDLLSWMKWLGGGLTMWIYYENEIRWMCQHFEVIVSIAVEC